MAQSKTNFPWDARPRKVRYTIGGYAVAVAVLFWCLPFLIAHRPANETNLDCAPNDSSMWPLRIAGLVTACFAMICFVEQASRVNAQKHTLDSEGRLLGRFLLWHRELPLNGFQGVSLRILRDYEGQHTWFVELLRPNGRPAVVCYFLGAEAGPAYSAARRLSEATGLPLQVKPD